MWSICWLGAFTRFQKFYIVVSSIRWWTRAKHWFATKNNYKVCLCTSLYSRFIIVWLYVLIKNCWTKLFLTWISHTISLFFFSCVRWNREDDQIVGALLTIPKVGLHNYGRYICRIEIGNAAHRLELSAWLFGTPVHARNDTIMPAVLLALGAVSLVIFIMFAVKYILMYMTIHQRRNKKLCQMMNSSETIRIREVIWNEKEANIKHYIKIHETKSI